MTPTSPQPDDRELRAMNDDTLREKTEAIIERFRKAWQPDSDDEYYADEAVEDIMQLIAARDEQRDAIREREIRIDELERLQNLHARTYRQTVTDNAGNIYVDESHMYISKYETQERIAELRTLTTNQQTGEK